MVFRPEVDDRLCFALMPFKDPFNGYYEHIIRPAVEEAGLKVMRADEIYGTRAIIRDIWDQIWRARIVVADVTEKNPNVNYELGLCHALGVPVVLITKRMEDVPFDYRHRRCIVYNTDEAGWEKKLRDDLRKTLQATAAEKGKEEDLLWPYDTSLVNETASRPSMIITGNPRDIVIQGTRAVVNQIGRAIGPAGIHYSSSISGKEPMPYKQGSSIAQGVSSVNPLEQRGIRELQVVAQEVYRLAGDGTKTGMLIAQSMMEQGNELLKQGKLAKDLIRGMEVAIDFVRTELLGRRRRPLRGEQVTQIAATAAADSAVGKLVAKAIESVGKDGVVTVEESSSAETELHVVEGMQFDRGYLHPRFITNPESGEAVLEDPYILIHSRKIFSMRELIPLLEQVAKEGRALFIIAEDVEGEALETLVVNKLRGVLKVAAVKAPGYGDRRSAVLEDIAVLTGGRVIGEATGITLANVTTDLLGTAKMVTVDSNWTTIFEGGGDLAEINGRIKAMRTQIEELASPYDREKVQERLARLVGGVAVIRVGGVSEVAVLDKKYRCVSGMHSVRAAIEGGWVPGGGLALFHISRSLRDRTVDNETEAAAVEIVAQALEAPFRRIIENAQGSPTQVVHEISQQDGDTIGFNAETDQIEDIGASGIIDAAMVLKSAVDVAFDHAKFILQTGDWGLDYKDETKTTEVI